MTVLTDVIIVGCMQAREGIEKFREQFETDMLSSFDKAYRHADPKVMAVRHTLSMASQLNGKVVRSYS